MKALDASPSSQRHTRYADIFIAAVFFYGGPWSHVVSAQRVSLSR